MFLRDVAVLILSGILVAGGVVIGLYVPASFSLGGWVTGLVLLGFAFVGRSVARKEEMPVAAANRPGAKGEVSVLLLATLLLAGARPARPIFRITDSRGTEVVVQSAAIEYGGFMASCERPPQRFPRSRARLRRPTCKRRSQA